MSAKEQPISASLGSRQRQQLAKALPAITVAADLIRQEIKDEWSNAGQPERREAMWLKHQLVDEILDRLRDYAE